MGKTLQSHGREVLFTALFFVAGVQAARLYDYWHRRAVWPLPLGSAENGGVAYFTWVALVLLPLILFGLLWEVAVSVKTHRGGAEKRVRQAQAAGGGVYQFIGKLKAREVELQRHHQIAKESAERHEQFNEQIILSIESALLTIGETGAVNTFNPAAEELFKQPGETVKGQPYAQVFERSPELVRLIDGALHQDLSFRRQEFHIADHNGQTHHVGAAVTPIRQPWGQTTGVLCLITDLTEIVELQQRIKLKENLASLGEITAGIAHEFKNALATIGGYAQLIAKETQDAEVAENIHVIRMEVAALSQTVSNFLDFAKPGAMVMEEISLAELVENCIRDLETESQFTHVRWAMEGVFSEVRADRILLKQALLNILRNAAEATPKERSERVVEETSATRVLVRGRIEQHGADKQVVVEIEDNGVGLSVADLEKIFLPFFTTKPSGTGLGLAITQKHIVFHNGKITAVRRSPDAGMRFIISLPAV